MFWSWRRVKARRKEFHLTVRESYKHGFFLTETIRKPHRPYIKLRIYVIAYWLPATRTSKKVPLSQERRH